MHIQFCTDQMMLNKFNSDSATLFLQGSHQQCTLSTEWTDWLGLWLKAVYIMQHKLAVRTRYFLSEAGWFKTLNLAPEVTVSFSLCRTPELPTCCYKDGDIRLKFLLCEAWRQMVRRGCGNGPGARTLVLFSQVEPQLTGLLCKEGSGPVRSEFILSYKLDLH